MANEIREMKTTPVNGPSGPTHAVMIALNMDEPARTREFAGEVLERFKLHRMVSPPDASLPLITIIGDVNLEEFADEWQATSIADAAANVFMSPMHVAECVHGTQSGNVLATRSLIQTR